MSTNEIQTKARELKELKFMQEELAAEISAIEDALKAAMGEQEELVCGEYKLTYQTVTSSRFDSTRFRKDHAELAAATYPLEVIPMRQYNTAIPCHGHSATKTSPIPRQRNSVASLISANAAREQEIYTAT